VIVLITTILYQVAGRVKPCALPQAHKLPVVPTTAAKGRIFISKAVIVLSLAKKNRDALVWWREFSLFCFVAPCATNRPN